MGYNLLTIHKWSIGARVGAGFALLTCLVIACTAIGWWAITTSIADMRVIYVDYTVSGTDLAKTGANLLRHRNAVLKSIAASSVEEFRTYANTLPEIERLVLETVKSYGSTVLRVSKTGRSEAKDLHLFEEALHAYFERSHATIENWSRSWTMKQEAQTVRESLRTEMIKDAETSERASAALKELLTTVTEVADGIYTDARIQGDRICSLLLGTLVLSVTIAVVGTTLVRRAILRPIYELRRTIHDIEEGDLTRRLTYDRPDELGDVCRDINRFAGVLQKTIAEFLSASHALAAASEELSANGDQLQQGSETQAHEMARASEAVQAMSLKSTEIAASAEEVALTVRALNQAASRGGETVAATMDKIRDLAAMVQETSRQIVSLGERSNEIGHIARVIDDIADQTNLLALNAAIEAARAGEQGRGFAVVADEVRKLAERTTKATKEIAGLIGTVQRDTGSAVSAMHRGSEEAVTSVTHMEAAQRVLSEILGGVRDVNDMVGQIAMATQTQTTATSAVSISMTGMTEISRHNEHSTGEVSVATRDLSTMATRLQGAVRQFTV